VGKSDTVRSEAERSDENRRLSPRESFEPIAIRGFTSLDHMTLISRSGYIVDASTTGFLIEVERKDLVPKEFRGLLSLDPLEGDQVFLMIEALNLELGGKIARTRRVSKDRYEIAIDFSNDAPEYWRECLLDLLPRADDFV
jgi:hypothetical protein